MVHTTETLQSASPRAAFSAVGREISGGRWLDIFVAFAVLVFTAPLLIVIAAMVVAQDGGPALFGHNRIGRGGRTFKCLKFRSMAVDAEAQLAALLARDPAARAEWARDQKLRNDPRITRLGLFLRRSSLDEIPQLINVLRGEMSLVGPRPIVADEVRHYGRHFHEYCAVRPGITGLWQVSGRNDVNYRRRVSLDVAYVRSRSLLLDLKILIATIPVVVLRRGSY